MPIIRTGYSYIVWLVPLLWLTHVGPSIALAQEPSADARALETEQKMTDGERFPMLISVMGVNSVITIRDKPHPRETIRATRGSDLRN